MKKILLPLAIVAASFTAQSSFAEGPSHDFIGLGYSQLNTDLFDADGFAIGASKTLSDNIAITATYLKGEVDGFPIDVSQFTVGVDFISEMNDTTDLVLGANYVNAEATAGGYSDDISGTLATIGVQTRVSPNVELSATLGYLYSSEEGVDDSFQFGVGIDYFVTESVSLGASYNNEDEANSVLVGAKYHF